MKEIVIGFLAGWIVSSADWWVYTSKTDRAWIIFAVAIIVTLITSTIEEAARKRRMRRWRMRRAFRQMELAAKQNRP
ncbi:MAG: hypothetical protein IJ794_09770 [Lachnospiraceae bacterium]|nr:hypothetical protein [Lachnospiraceae bacterium]